MIPIILAVISSFPIAIFLYKTARRRRAAACQPTSDWQSLAGGIFETAADPAGGDRLEAALLAGARKLGLSHAILTIQEGSTGRILRLSSETYAVPKSLVTGRSITRNILYCGELGVSRATLAIDIASMTEWRNHGAYRKFGWESYIGACAALSGGSYLTVGFYQAQPRDRLFSASEKEFTRQMANWIAAIVQREPRFLHAAAAQAEQSEMLAQA